MDLAWGPRRTTARPQATGLAVADDAGRLLDVAVRHTDEEILAWLRPWTDGPCLVAFDAPIVVVNPTGHRPGERLVSSYFGRYGASCHSANTASPSFANGSRALRLAQALNLELAPGGSSRQAAEVYPHPALVVLFDLPSILRYKDKPGRDFAYRSGELNRLADLLESLATADPPLDPTTSPAWHELRAALAGATRKVDLKRCEDAFDAVVCAYVAAYAHAVPDRVRYFGDPATGQILVPVTPALADRFDEQFPPARADQFPPRAG